MKVGGHQPKRRWRSTTGRTSMARSEGKYHTNTERRERLSPAQLCRVGRDCHVENLGPTAPCPPSLAPAPGSSDLIAQSMVYIQNIFSRLFFGPNPIAPEFPTPFGRAGDSRSVRVHQSRQDCTPATIHQGFFYIQG